MTHRFPYCHVVLFLTIIAAPRLRAQQPYSRLNDDFLHAVGRGDIAEAKALLDRGADVNAQIVNGIFALEQAIDLANDDLVKLLIERGANVNLSNDFGDTALIAAVKQDRQTVIPLLLEHGADVHASGDRALLKAIDARHEKVFEMLLAHGANARAADAEGATAIMLAARTGSMAMVKALVDRGAGADPNAADKQGNTLFIYAVRSGSAELIKSMLDRGANPRAVNSQGRTAIMNLPAPAASESGAQIIALLRLLQEKGVDINAKDKRGQTALLDAVKQYLTEAGGQMAKVEMVKALLNGGAKVDQADAAGNTPLIVSLSGYPPNPQVVNLLLDRKADPNARSGEGKTALMIAAQHCDEPAAMALIAKGADVNVRDRQGATALMEAAGAGRRSAAPFLKLLLEHGAAIDAQDQQGATAIFRAIESGSVELVQLLIDAGAKVTDPKLSLASARNHGFLLALAASRVDEANSLLDAGADVNFANREGRTALMIVAENELPIDFAGRLIDKGATIDAVDANGQTPLMFAADRYNAELVELLLKRGAKIDAVDKQGANVLIHACRSRRDYQEEQKPLIGLLLERGADPKSKDAKGVTALMLTAGHGNPAIVALLEKGAPVDARDGDGNTALLYASRHFITSGCRKAGVALLNKGADINVANDAGQTVLMRAATQFEPEMISYLLERHANVNARANDGRTALIAVIDSPTDYSDVEPEAGRVFSLPIVKVLIDAGADVNAADALGSTPLHLAARRGHIKAVELLLEHKADVNAKDKQGRTPLTEAIEHKNTAVSETLQKAGAKN
ncbi:MAG TPA: ankyrin repeat domain-containing protein [Humisphaera sp.]|jgi:ankyrin repeat protein|nr:ankyrin repeat domain-containing protein [Humisphaera sp.]